MFVFGHEELGDGSDDKPLRLGFTSRKMLQNINIKDSLFHIDLTYKIIKQAYPLLVFGVSDKSRQFHPIAFMFLSHWCEEDFLHFFKSLIKITDQLRIILDMKLVCQDADMACFNAIMHLFPDTIVIMCWFHVMINVKKEKI